MNIYTTYTIFLYLGIAFFVIHLFLNGLGLNISYFGLILIYIGFKKPVLSTWFRTFLWIFIALEIYGSITEIRNRMKGPKKMVKFDENVKEGISEKK